MIVYNVTFSVDLDIADEWLAWIKNKHIPGLSEFFVDCRILKVLTTDDDKSASFAVQYYADSLKQVEQFLMRNYQHPFGEKVVGFPTLLEEI